MEVQVVKDVPDEVDLVVQFVGAAGVGAVEPAVRTITGFEAKVGQTALVGDGPPWLLVGTGPDEAPDARAVRRAAAAATRAASRATHVAVLAPGDHHQALGEGLALGAYAFTAYKSEPAPGLATVTVVAGGGARVRAAIERGVRIGTAVNTARDLVNEPGGTLTATAFAARAAALGKAHGFRVDVLDEKAIDRAGHAGLLAVNQGSHQPPRFLELTYEPEGRARGSVALVGKGVTFDSGGLSLKPADGMLTMKDDMGGAAAVLAAVSACRDLGVKTKVRAFIPLTDNMTGGDAQRVGDVIRYRNGRTVEVLNTDAEGRLILADGLIAASEENPDAVIDMATLTGAQQVALGNDVAALFAGHDGLAAALLDAADRAGEGLWRMPLVDSYRPAIDSKVADLRNVAAHRHGGAIVAALFLREFVGEGLPWAHVDIAGPAWRDAEEAGEPAGGTGYGVRTLLALLTGWRKLA